MRAALAESTDALPRPMAALGLPAAIERMLAPTLLHNLRPASVLVPLMRRPQGLSMLLTRRTDHLRAHSGQISFPGGRRDDTDVSAADTALREAEEEVGLPRSHAEVLGYLDDYPTISRFRVTPVVALISGEPSLLPAPDEVAEIFEVPLELLLNPQSYERNFLSREGVNMPFFEINYGAYRIWGATAGILRNLCQLVNP